MLTAPAITSVDGVTVWGDDTDFFKCYLTSAHPRLRLDEDGEPIFLLVQYAIADQDRLANPSPARRRRLHELRRLASRSRPEEEEAARAEMQPQVDAEWERRRNGTEEEQELERRARHHRAAAGRVRRADLYRRHGEHVRAAVRAARRTRWSPPARPT